MKREKNDLFHVGILGMKWGRRSNRNTKTSSKHLSKSGDKKAISRKKVSSEEAKKFIQGQKQQKVINISKAKERAARLGKAASILITAYSVVSVATLLNPRFVGDIAWTTGKIISNTPLR